MKGIVNSMRKRLIKIVFAILGIGIGYSFFPWAWRLANFNQPWLVNPIMNMFLGLVIMSFLGLLLSNPLEALIKKIESSLLHQKPEVLITEGISMIVGLVIAALISTLFSHSQLFFFNTILPSNFPSIVLTQESTDQDGVVTLKASCKLGDTPVANTFLYLSCDSGYLNKRKVLTDTQGDVTFKWSPMLLTAGDTCEIKCGFKIFTNLANIELTV